MKNKIHFIKCEALGNDFVLLYNKIINPATIRKIGNRKTGIGFDQLLVLTKDIKNKLQLRFYNQDGSEAEMCANGLRVAGYHYMMINHLRKVEIFTKVGKHLIQITKKRRVVANIGSARIEKIDPSLKPLLTDHFLKYKAVSINVGNPHFVLVGSIPNQKVFETWGHTFENHRAFPNRTNVEFIKKEKYGCFVKVWERGVGETKACGSGAIAAAAAIGLKKGIVKFIGGEAKIYKIKGEYYLESEVSISYSGYIEV